MESPTDLIDMQKLLNLSWPVLRRVLKTANIVHATIIGIGRRVGELYVQSQKPEQLPFLSLLGRLGASTVSAEGSAGSVFCPVIERQLNLSENDSKFISSNFKRDFTRLFSDTFKKAECKNASGVIAAIVAKYYDALKLDPPEDDHQYPDIIRRGYEFMNQNGQVWGGPLMIPPKLRAYYPNAPECDDVKSMEGYEPKPPRKAPTTIKSSTAGRKRKLDDDSDCETWLTGSPVSLDPELPPFQTKVPPIHQEDSMSNVISIYKEIVDTKAQQERIIKYMEKYKELAAEKLAERNRLEELHKKKVDKLEEEYKAACKNAASALQLKTDLESKTQKLISMWEREKQIREAGITFIELRNTLVGVDHAGDVMQSIIELCSPALLPKTVSAANELGTASLELDWASGPSGFLVVDGSSSNADESDACKALDNAHSAIENGNNENVISGSSNSMDFSDLLTLGSVNWPENPNFPEPSGSQTLPSTSYSILGNWVTDTTSSSADSMSSFDSLSNANCFSIVK